MKDHRPAVCTVSCGSNAVVVGVVTLGKWLVNLTGEAPLRPDRARARSGKPMYKPTVKTDVTRRHKPEASSASFTFVQ